MAADRQGKVTWLAIPCFVDFGATEGTCRAHGADDFAFLKRGSVVALLLRFGYLSFRSFLQIIAEIIVQPFLSIVRRSRLWPMGQSTCFAFRAIPVWRRQKQVVFGNIFGARGGGGELVTMSRARILGYVSSQADIFGVVVFENISSISRKSFELP